MDRFIIGNMQFKRSVEMTLKVIGIPDINGGL
jgi:hypothetical protein